MVSAENNTQHVGMRKLIDESKFVAEREYVIIQIEGIQVRCLVDTGSNISILDKGVINQMKGKQIDEKKNL